MEKLLAYLNSKRGRRTELASRIGINPGALSQWTRVPADRVVAVEAVTGIPRQVLRPDIFGVQADQSSAA